MQLPEFRRACLHNLPEKPGEIRRILKTKLVCDFGNVQVRMSQKALGFQDQPPLEVLRKVSSCLLANELIQPAPGHTQESGYFRGARYLIGARVQSAQKTSCQRRIL